MWDCFNGFDIHVLGVIKDPIENLHGIALVAEVDGDEVGPW
jgi:hypothetical protein